MTTPSTSADGAVTDVVVIGDGPAGSALASACRRLGVDVLLLGDDAAWTATYSTWLDDLDVSPGEALVDPLAVTAMVSPTVWAYGARRHELQRTYATLDNERLRAALRDGVEHRVGRVQRVATAPGGGRDVHRVHLDSGDVVRARLVVDASGWPAKFATGISGAQVPAWQTALGVVLPEPPAGELGRPTFMDFRAVVAADGARSSVGPHGVTTFCYSLPMPDGWLVEETVLAGRPAIEPIALLPRLAARLGRHPDALLAEAVRTEYVRIPLGGARPSRDQPVVAFGAAAGYVHAATGFSVAASIRAAPRVARAILTVVGSSNGACDPGPVADAVWPTASRRTRVLHDHGLEVLLDFDDDDVRWFFDAFFDLPVEQWAAYMRIDSAPTTIIAVMTSLFRSSSWPVRRRLMGRNPLALARLVRP